MTADDVVYTLNFAANPDNKVKTQRYSDWIKEVVKEGPYKVKILLKFDIDMTIVQFKILKRSGNRLFDDSIQNAIDRVRAEVKRLPTPPEAIAGVVFGRGIAITLHGADAR